MASFNRVIVCGNLGQDPEVKYTNGGTAVCELSVACSRSWFDKSSNEKREETTWVPVQLWGRTAEIAGEYLRKGRPVLIEGRLQMDQWEDKQSGQKRTKMKVVCENMQMVGSRGDGDGGGGGSRRSSRNDAPQGDPADSFYDMPSSGPSAGDEVPF